MAFGIYVHIPYCLQICPYCDFTKYELGKSLQPEKYVELLLKEIRTRSHAVPYKEIDTIYFGGGTPSLLSSSSILAILEELANEGFTINENREVTIEIDPTTCDQKKLDQYLSIGINRFSVGAQSFNDRLLKLAGRKHSRLDVIEILTLLKKNQVNYSYDLLFALPTQTLQEVKEDVSTVIDFDPSHISTYVLNVPEGHRMSHHRAPDEEQVEMFHVIKEVLQAAQIHQYEISNFAQRGRESAHNLLYWTDQPYWGLGISAHSYFPKQDQNSEELPWGLRFWNTRNMRKFEKEILTQETEKAWDFSKNLPKDQIEALELHQAITDFCHTSLRLTQGLEENALRLKFGEVLSNKIRSRLESLVQSQLLEPTQQGWCLSDQGRLLANLAFEKLTFLRDDPELSFLR